MNRFFFMSGTSSIVIGFSFATCHGCKSLMISNCHYLNDSTSIGVTASTLIPIILGLMILACGGVYEAHTDRDALFPVATFSDLTIGEASPILLADRY
jgi:hypothetical protein